MSGDDVRAALLTPRAPGGIAVVALCGEARAAAAARLLADAAPIDRLPRLRWLVVAGERIDQAIVFDRPECATIEVHLHGSEAVLRALEGVLGRLAPPARPLRDGLLSAAASEAQLDFALEQQRLLAPYRGSFARFVHEHAQDPAVLRAARARHAAAAALTVPCTVALCGRKNAGKSTLMNRLLFAERALAGATPGLTRDPVREPVTLDGYPYVLIDTAGEGGPGGAVDARAIALGREARAGALNLLLVDAAAGFGEVERMLLAQAPSAVVVRSKIDLPPAAWPPDLAPPALDISCRDAAHAPQVRARLGALLRRVRGLGPAGALGGVAALDDGELALLRTALGA